MKLCSVLILSTVETKSWIASEEIPWASGVLRGSGCFAIEEEKDTSVLATTDARQIQFRFIERCLAVREKPVKWERDRPD
jgi:hypothetical protein